MSIVLGRNQYGKAENHVVRIYRDSARHEIRDITVSSALRGDFTDAHITGDQARVLPTDTQKNTVYAYAKKVGVEQIEPYALALGRHFVDDTAPVEGARIEVDEHAWERISVGGEPHDHSFVRKGQEIRNTVVTIDGKGDNQSAWVVSGLRELVVLKSTGSEFAGFLTDGYTTLQETRDRVMATTLSVRWRYTTTDVDWGKAYAGIRRILVEQFASVHSLALQQTLFEMGKGVLEARDDVAEVQLSAPNIHHFAYDLERFGLENNNEVFHADDRPYGLIQATVQRDDAPAAGRAGETSWSS
ncbi:MAG: urate oxidase [Actinomycetota bacterium]|nr:urate oxidase [Nocardioidaceae bacterium]MDQ3480424.1 urate oxidase [Actinomycetota bacterium]